MEVDKQVTHLVKGYDRILAEARKYSGPLKSKRPANAASENIPIQGNEDSTGNNKPASRGQTLLAMSVTALSAITGCWAFFQPQPQGILLVSLALFISCGTWLWWLLYRRRGFSGSRSRSAENFSGDDLATSLANDWLARLSARQPARAADYGEAGEQTFIEAVERRFGREAFLLHRFQQTPGEDLDVLLVGPRGIWLFEVKHWSGVISWQKGRWSRLKRYYKAGGVLTLQAPTVEQPPDEQWRRMAAEIVKTFTLRGRSLVGHQPELSAIRGGIVFSHPDAVLYIPRSAPFGWGKSGQWVERINKAPRLPGMTVRTSLEVLDVLLGRHQQLNPDLGLQSMEAYAVRLIDAAGLNQPG